MEAKRIRDYTDRLYYHLQAEWDEKMAEVTDNGRIFTPALLAEVEEWVGHTLQELEESKARVEAKSRKDFEAWLKETTYQGAARSLATGGYMDESTQTKWIAWCAARVNPCYTAWHFEHHLDASTPDMIAASKAWGASLAAL